MMLLVQQHNSDQSVRAGQLENDSLMRKEVAKPNGKRFSTTVRPKVLFQQKIGFQPYEQMKHIYHTTHVYGSLNIPMYIVNNHL